MFGSTSNDDRISKAVEAWNALTSRYFISESDVMGITVHGRSSSEVFQRLVLRVEGKRVDPNRLTVVDDSWDAVIFYHPMHEFSHASVLKCIRMERMKAPEVVYTKPLVSKAPKKHVDLAHGINVSLTTANDQAATLNAALTRAFGQIATQTATAAMQMKNIGLQVDANTGQVMKKRPDGTYEPYVALGARASNVHKTSWDGENYRVECKCKLYCHERYEWVGKHPQMTLLYDSDGSDLTMSLPIALGITDVTFTVENEDDMFYVSDNGVVGIDLSLTPNDPISNIVQSFEDALLNHDRYNLFVSMIKDGRLHLHACNSGRRHKRNVLALSRIPKDAPDATIRATAIAMTYHDLMSGRCFMCANDSLRRVSDFSDDAPDF